MTKHRDKPIPAAKLAIVKGVAASMKKYPTVLLASCKGLPSSQFHAIKKQLRGKADVKVVKKKAAIRAIDLAAKGKLGDLKKELNADFALFFSEMDAFALSGLLADNQIASKARPGDIAPEDIEIQAGPTELVPGPAISELSGVGLKVAVKEGKLEITKGAVVVKKGEVVKDNVAGVLGKLGINPMRVGFLPIAAYDAKDDRVYVGIRINKEESLNELRELIKKAAGFAIGRDYYAAETIKYFLAKASMQEKAFLGKLSTEASTNVPTDTTIKEGI